MDEVIEDNKPKPNYSPQIAYNTVLSQPPKYNEEKYNPPTINLNSDALKNAVAAQLESSIIESPIIEPPVPNPEIQKPSPEMDPPKPVERYPELSNKQLCQMILKEELTATGFDSKKKVHLEQNKWLCYIKNWATLNKMNHHLETK